MQVYKEPKNEKQEARKDAKKLVRELIMHGVNPSLIYKILVDEGHSQEEIKEARRYARDQGAPFRKPLRNPLHSLKKDYFRIYSILFIIILISLLTIILYTELKPWPKGGNYTYEPTQETYTQEEPIIIQKGNYTFYITPKATYNATVMIAHTKRHYTGPAAPISPIDMIFIWGFITTEDFTSHIKFTQTGRCSFFRLKKESPYDYRYVGLHSSNNHIIPANDELKKEILSIRKHEIVTMEGYLVNARSPGKLGLWESSMTRTDQGEKGCEIFYVNKIIRKGKMIH